MSDHADIVLEFIQRSMPSPPESGIAAIAALYFLVAERDRLREALRYMVDYQMTGSEMTLHIDFQGKARAALGEDA